jgi:hypothetical protein
MVTILKESTMRKTVLSILAASLIVGSTAQIATAAERHTHKLDRVRMSASQQFRNANDFLPSPSVGQQDSSNLSEGYMTSGPPGR